MPAVVSHLVKLFADESKLIATIRSNNDLALLQHDLGALSEWSNKWRMLFNVDKCKVMEFSRSGKSHFAESELLIGDPGSRSRRHQEGSGSIDTCRTSQGNQEEHEETVRSGLNQMYAAS